MQIAEIIWVKNALLFDKYDRKHVCVCQCTRLRERRSDKTCAYHEEIAGFPRICKKYPHIHINEQGNDLIWQYSPCDWGKS